MSGESHSVDHMRQVTPGCLVKIERNGNVHVLKFFLIFSDSYIEGISEQNNSLSLLALTGLVPCLLKMIVLHLVEKEK